MPLYDFTCEKCRQPFERLVRKEAEIATIVCPNCHSPKVERQLSLPAKPGSASQWPTTACGSGPPCGASWCQRPG